MNRFWIVDVFTDRKYAGNQLAVVRNDTGLSTDAMQAIAREMNFSETTFLSPEPAGGAHPTRIFHPTDELPFAGHPTIGTAWVLRHELSKGSVDEINLDVPAGRVPVRFDADGTAWMKPPAPGFGDPLDPGLLSRAVGLGLSDLDPDFPVQIMSSPTPKAFIPLRSLEAAQRARYDVRMTAELQQANVPRILYLFTRETESSGADLHARLFAPELGIVEDAATGSASGCLAAYASETRYLGDSRIEATIEQGLEMGRPSRIQIRANGSSDVEVGGRAVIVASGELR